MNLGPGHAGPRDSAIADCRLLEADRLQNDACLVLSLDLHFGEDVVATDEAGNFDSTRNRC
jgi:hypothetical protein